jgi:hypothetical protein
MSDKNQEEEKEVLFKLRFSKQKDSSKTTDQPQMISEWNYTRIGSALIGLFVLVAIGISIFLIEDSPTEPKKNSQSIQIQKIETNISQLPTAPPDTNVIKETQSPVIVKLPTITQTSKETPAQISGSVVRALLAKGIWQNEPFRKISGTIKVNSKDATGIFYFTELENMKDQSIFHIWRYKGDIIFKKQKHVTENQWQTYTSKLFTKRSIGSWSVETVDSNNRQLNLINFNVVSATD